MDLEKVAAEKELEGWDNYDGSEEDKSDDEIINKRANYSCEDSSRMDQPKNSNKDAVSPMSIENSDELPMSPIIGMIPDG